MGFAAKYVKQPAEVLDYPFDFTEYLQEANDVAVSHTVVASDGINVVSSTLARGIVRAFVSGGESGRTYKVSATVTTQGGRVKQLDIQLKVKEI